MKARVGHDSQLTRHTTHLPARGSSPQHERVWGVWNRGAVMATLKNDQPRRPAQVEPLTPHRSRSEINNGQAQGQAQQQSSLLDMKDELFRIVRDTRKRAPVQYDQILDAAWARMIKDETTAGTLEVANMDAHRRAQFMLYCDLMPLYKKTLRRPHVYGPSPLIGQIEGYDDFNDDLPHGATTWALLHDRFRHHDVKKDDNSDVEREDPDDVHFKWVPPTKDKGKKRAIEIDHPEGPPSKKTSSNNVPPRDDKEKGKGKSKAKDKGKGKARERDVEPEILYLSDDNWMGERYTFIPHKARPAKPRPAAGGQGPAPRAKARPFQPDEDEWDSSPPPRSPSPDRAACRPALPSAPAEAAPGPSRNNIPEQLEKAALEMILAVIPDVEPQHAQSLYRQALYGQSVDHIVEKLLTEPYPKIVVGAKTNDHKRKRDDAEDDMIDSKGYLNIETRASPYPLYQQAAQGYLLDDFPLMRQADIMRVYKNECKYFYAPTYIKLHAAMKQNDRERGFTLMKKLTTRQQYTGYGAESVEDERTWVLRYVDRDAIRKRREEERAWQEKEEIEKEIKSGAFFECGCCFGDTAFSRIATCSEGCQFCRDCATQNVNTQIGMRKCVIPCMSVDGCAAIFRDSELERFLPSTTLAALEKIRQEKEVDLAELEGLEKCPFCSFACIIDNPNEKLFHCISDACRKVSCRSCKKKDHLPRTCKEEAAAEEKINSVHKVEEAMSEALIRKCPNTRCGEPYIKEDGCNKMTCPSCRTMSCFICGKIVSGYEHFKNAGFANAPKGSDANATCLLWDDHKTRTFQEVEAARATAAAEVLNANPNIDKEALKKLADKAPPIDPRYPVPHLPVQARPAPAAPVPNMAAPAPRGARGKAR
ncbi:BZ3500_MvSof-1268-A1-R1_Chr1-1g01022 [Microbotryum saponariae]|uniref:BZ3500_MvSof-1268-A1-R1_Chr1-1g01022 protein n=1 Tax=Microbotryum saponariae TaxID=289078 RepID=A0A2X0KP63_9BASI|nr:BZ3500_MvSof-1268-A1-R1_Chr1-1g01022 [Microbotryum saponariae]SCZ93206.1 BZ3501_MvSof-1269-A2-R1_Chr1-1g00619 [Microbotryum saponariae]